MCTAGRQDRLQQQGEARSTNTGRRADQGDEQQDNVLDSILSTGTVPLPCLVGDLEDPEIGQGRPGPSLWMQEEVKGAAGDELLDDTGSPSGPVYRPAIAPSLEKRTGRCGGCMLANASSCRFSDGAPSDAPGWGCTTQDTHTEPKRLLPAK